MPGLDGFGVLAALAGDPATCDIPVVISTSLPVDTALRSRLSRATMVLSKASLSRELVEAALRGAERAAA